MIRDPDTLRPVSLFGKPYQWDRTGGRLTLTATPPEPAAGPPTFDQLASLLGGPLPGWPTAGQPGPA